ncbi:N-acetylglucosamine kinase [Litoribacter populi]|uniref:N-acetylglucosamine kinase n=1 Tax=Litoribacter populi TaxID=2598460 RepID=UPI0011808D8E|nr:N-acetylglucosamine kinase [Litoribacter populi]
MILIADSGSSKTDWRTIGHEGQINQFRTVGFNPYYQSLEEMVAGLKQPSLLNIQDEVSQIYYYGAGCSSVKNNKIVEHALKQVFHKAKIEVHHDLLAAARATCGSEPGIACILGTGSNSCDYDGSDIVETRPAPGYILGDEGGGSYIGRQFLHDFIYEEMPENIRDLAIQEYQFSSQDIQENVYQKPFPGRYMASFCRFITQHKNDPYCYKLYQKAFNDFFQIHVMKYDNYQEKPVNFVGSIAYYNSDILRSVAFDLNISVNIILETPIAGLTLFHKEKI